MEKTTIIESLTKIGLDEKAASIYTALLGKSRLGVADIARASGLKRATCYEYLDTLLQNNFITRIPIGKRMYYGAENPNKILTAYKKKTYDFESKLEEMVKVHEQATDKPKVTFHEGKQSLGLIYERLFTSMGDTYSIFPPDAFFENFSLEDYEAFDKQNSEHAIKTKDLFVASAHTKKLRNLRKKNGYLNKHDKVLPAEFKTNVDVLVFSDTVALISLRGLSAVVIENKDIADLFKNLHNHIWKSL